MSAFLLLLLAQTSTPVPARHIPPSVVMEMRALETQFDLALSADCAPERCVSKGCVYQDHVTVDLPRNGSLPGLDQNGGGPGSVPVQEYLTLARCDFAHEKSVNIKDINALQKRMEQRLSKGWLKVTVTKQMLEPVPESLRESPTPAPEPVKPAEPPPAPAPEVKPEEWGAAVALRELWKALLPHFFWMTGIVLVSIAALTLIWAARRVGKPSIEERAMLAQLESGQLNADDEAAAKAAEAAPTTDAEGLTVVPTDTPELAAQRRRWEQRFAKQELLKDDTAAAELLRDWLKAREFPLLAKSIFLFGDRLLTAFPADGEYAQTKAEFVEYLKGLNPATLMSDADFFSVVDTHAISSSLLAQNDADTWMSLREEFGSTGATKLIATLPNREGALLFAMLAPDTQEEVARMLAPDKRWAVAVELLSSNRITRDERSHLFELVDAARAGLPLPAAQKRDGSDRGATFDAAGALSVLLQHVDAKERPELFQDVLEKSNGVFPAWFEDILFPDMVLKLPTEARADLVLGVDIKALAGWVSVQPRDWQQQFIASLSASMQTAMRANLSFTSRADQLSLARKGRAELVAAVKRQLAGGHVTFGALVA